MINNQIYQPVEFRYTYTIGGKENLHQQLQKSIPQKHSILSNEQKQKIKDEILSKFEKGKIIKKPIVKQVTLKINHKRFFKLYLKFKVHKNRIRKLILGKRIQKIERERINILSYENEEVQIKFKDQYDKEYDKGKVKKIKKKREIQKLDFDKAYKLKYNK